MPEFPAFSPRPAFSTASSPTQALSPEGLAAEQDRAACRALIRTGSKSFFTASLLLPAALRDDAYVLYAFCRLSDDAVDVDRGAEAAVARLRARLDAVYAGAPFDHPVDRALADVVARHDLPRALPEALIDGLAWDVAGVRCETLADVYAYAARVAGSVGAMMAVLMGARSPDLAARACDLGVAMQLTNIARDVGEDARAGRLYLPRSWMREAGLDPDAWLRAPTFGPQLASVVARLLDAADQLYRRAEHGIAALPAACRPGIFAARYIYAAIGFVVAARGFDSVSGRARVSLPHKLVLLVRSVLAATAPPSSAPSARPLVETAYLVDAVAATYAPDRSRRSRRPGWGERVSDRIVWVAQLFAELEARQQSRA
ncbi:MAG: phytoene/squalene synthase family protein, partial [Rhodospirillaceae bacterium]|nr:phytoene/squalene synthase family protein [Rhodospirillaceae bacterium]